jgi:hypothetical protein
VYACRNIQSEKTIHKTVRIDSRIDEAHFFIGEIFCGVLCKNKRSIDAILSLSVVVYKLQIFAQKYGVDGL